VGRNPFTLDLSVQCTAIADPELSVSKVHLEYGITAAGLWVKDRGSTNGSRLERPGRPPVTLAPAEAVPLAVGDTVWFGKRHFRVEEAA